MLSATVQPRNPGGYETTVGDDGCARGYAFSTPVTHENRLPEIPGSLVPVVPNIVILGFPCCPWHGLQGYFQNTQANDTRKYSGLEDAYPTLDSNLTWKDRKQTRVLLRCFQLNSKLSMRGEDQDSADTGQTHG